MTVDNTDLTLCPTCRSPLTDTGLHPSMDGSGQDWVYMCVGCRRDVIRQHIPGGTA